MILRRPKSPVLHLGQAHRRSPTRRDLRRQAASVTASSIGEGQLFLPLNQIGRCRRPRTKADVGYWESARCGLYFSTCEPMQCCRPSSDGQLVSWAAFHESCSVRIASNLYSGGINYRQKVGDLLSEPESPSNIGQFSYPITVLCWLH
jgi:hypothetical protein